jgi:hypothetical protein
MRPVLSEKVESRTVRVESATVAPRSLSVLASTVTPVIVADEPSSRSRSRPVP